MNLATNQKMRGFYFENIGDKNMKKIIITVAVAVVAAIAAQAQSAGAEVRFAHEGFKGALAQKAPSAKKKTSSKSLEQAVERQVAKQVAASAKGETAPAAIKAPAAKTANKPAAGTTKTSSVRAWLKSVFLGGPFPGETPEAYHARLIAQSHPSALPYK